MCQNAVSICIFLMGFWLIFPRSEGSAAYHIITVCHPCETFILQYGYCKNIYKVRRFFMSLLIFLVWVCLIY
jgi:hypothetical protein